MGKSLGTAAAFASMYFLHLEWWLAGIIGLAVWFMMMPKQGSTKLIQVIDLETGSIKTQPVDKAAEKYLATRND